VIKPVCEGSTIGMSIASGAADIEEGIRLAKRYDSTVLVEKFVAGVEVTVVVIGNERPKPLPVLEIVPKNGSFYDYNAKYAQGGSSHYCPARIDERLAEKCQEMSVKAHRILGCSGVSRSDIIIDSDGRCWLLETNTVPGMTSMSLVPDAARVAGLDFPELCALCVDLGIQRKEFRAATPCAPARPSSPPARAATGE
jgi:D-alanine-D-alanine ligase